MNTIKLDRSKISFVMSFEISNHSGGRTLVELKSLSTWLSLEAGVWIQLWLSSSPTGRPADPPGSPAILSADPPGSSLFSSADRDRLIWEDLGSEYLCSLSVEHLNYTK